MERNGHEDPVQEQVTESIPEKIRQLSLSMIKKKLMQPPPEGEGWSRQEAEVAELWYRRYLTLVNKYPEQTIVPNEPIDAFWHQHILDTRRYREDCEKIFGNMLHHYPYLGLNGDADVRDKAFKETNRLYRVEFGEDCRNMFSGINRSDTASAMGCGDDGSGTGCSQQNCSGGDH